MGHEQPRPCVHTTFCAQNEGPSCARHRCRCKGGAIQRCISVELEMGLDTLLYTSDKRDKNGFKKWPYCRFCLGFVGGIALNAFPSAHPHQ